MKMMLIKKMLTEKYSVRLSTKHRLLITTSILLMLIPQITCRPSSQSKSSKVQSIGFQKAEIDSSEVKIENCYKDMDLNELCQRCEKINEKQHDVFAMCCSNEDGATDYCRSYVYYGVNK